MTNRLKVLEASLEKKTATLNGKIDTHFKTVAEANGQPLNDKRNGGATLNKWDRQNNAIRNQFDEIEKTKNAIEREQSLISNVNGFDVPVCLQGFLADSKITQWRKHPRFFFVNGVEKARIVVCEDGTIAARYVKEIPNSEQYATFRDLFNAARAIQNETS